MRPKYLPSLRALSASDGCMLTEELRLVATKRQLAIVRTLADEIERCVRCGGAPQTLREQLVGELARLGCRSLETAVAIAEKPVNIEEQCVCCVLAVAAT